MADWMNRSALPFVCRRKARVNFWAMPFYGQASAKATERNAEPSSVITRCTRLPKPVRWWTAARRKLAALCPRSSA